MEMKKKVPIKTKIKISILFSMILLSSFYAIFLTNFNNPSNNLGPNGDDKTVEDDTDLNPVETLKSSAFGEHPWWDSNWPYRILINITNDAGVDLKNYGVWVVFPYEDFENKVNDTLKDIRIIEYENNVGREREYFIFQDYSYSYDPIDEEHTGSYDEGKATIFFNTNISASATSLNPERDIYIYFGNMAVESTADEQGLGLIKNGVFDYVPSGDDPVGNPEVAPYSYNPVGWNWSHNVPNEIVPWGDIYADDDSDHPTDPLDHWQNSLINDPDNQEKKLGSYTYKWGTNETSIPWETQQIQRANDNYAGVLYSNYFIVPIVGDGNPLVDKLYLNLWRNIRTCGFDRKKTGGDVDGYYVRIINASAGIGNPDSHQGFDEYLEIYAGITNNNGGSQLYNYTTGTQGNTVTTYSGDLDESVIFDISQYMGMNISIEIGMYGDEGVGNDDMAFGQVDEIYFTYDVDLTIELNEYQDQKSEITVITRDVDGMIVPNAEVTLIGETTTKTQTTDESGETIFTNLNYGIYNFSVNYTFSATHEDVVFNSTEDNFGTSSWNLYNVSDLSASFDLNLDIWTIDFEINDWDEELLDDGRIKVFSEKDGEFLKQLTLVNGTARFRWNNRSHYYYEVYFYNTEYNVNNFLLNASYIYRSNYVQNEKNYDHSLDVASYDEYTGSDYYRVYERIYSGGSMTDFSNKKLINFNVTLDNIQDRLDNMTIYYIDYNNQTSSSNIIYQNLAMSGTDFFLSIDIGTVDNNKLKNEEYKAHGILIDVRGYTAGGAHSGEIKINTTELINVYNKTALSKLNIRVIDDDDAENPYGPVEYVSVRIYNGTPVLANLITVLTTNAEGWASHSDEYYKPFIFLIGFSYNITLRRIGEATNFIVNDTIPEGQWEPTSEVSIYNFTLNLNSTVILDFEPLAPIPDLITQIELISAVSQAIWGDGDLEIVVNVSYSDDDGSTWNLMEDVGDIKCYIQDWESGKIVLIKDMVANLQGSNVVNYSITFNSNELSAGNSYKKYWFIIDGEVPGYEDPEEPLYQEIQVNATASFLDLHDYVSLEIVSQYEKEYGEIVKLAVRYYDDVNNPLSAATVTFKWVFSPTKYFSIHPIDGDYYYVSFNTSEALSAALYPVTITAALENHTEQIVISYLDVLNRKTSLNGKTDIAYMSKKVWVEQADYFNFTYKDITNGADCIIGNLDMAIYTWQELDGLGNPISGNDGNGILIQNEDGTYTLDFETEIRSVGFYSLYITMQKENYELRAAIINLEIMLREFDADLDAPRLKDDQVSVVKGKEIELELELTDLTRGDIPLEGAEVVLEIGDDEYEFDDEGDGKYTLTFKTKNIEAFFTANTLSGQIIIKMANFTTDEIDLTIIVEMEEIYEGMPTFYFIMLVASIAGIIGSLVSYRVIQQARIPGYVKKLRKVKSTIKAGKSITESYSIPSMERMLVKEFGKEWQKIGFSLEDILGTKAGKSPDEFKEDKFSKQGGGNE
ncbi:MAG: hypothetical protein EU539_06670 [Promethearchaeota archaeon]|nr:MAG: hypothetical protein EU539_06670 [Candidatus Lokiarchaeota archaeon]